MICKHCNEEVEEFHKFCPFCGKSMVEEEPAKKKVWPMVAWISAAVVALAALALVLLAAMGIVDLKPRGNDILRKDNYTVEDSKAEAKAAVAVATMGDKELTNSQLMLYYRSQFIDFANYYGSYLSSIGLDTTKPLSEQFCTFEGYTDMTWQQYLLDIAIETWQNYQILGLLAEENGFVLSDEVEAEIASVRESLEKQATDGAYESADAMVADIIGVGCTLDDYMEFVRLAYLAGEYYESEVERLTPNQDEIDAYFTENADAFAQNGITKESGLYASVRHILIMPEGGTTDETTGVTTYSDDEWAACLAKAESLLQQWKDGEATEASFGEMAMTETADEYSAASGGLYEGVYKGSGMVEAFESWTIDASRVKGDTAIVKTEYGYHLMYFVDGELNWVRTARTQLLAERTKALIDDASAKWPLEVTYSKIAIPELDMT